MNHSDEEYEKTKEMLRKAFSEHQTLEVNCKDCGSKVKYNTKNKEETCSKCGYILKFERHDIFESVSGVVPTVMKDRKTKSERRIGTEWSTSRQKLVNKKRIIDKVNKRYEEVITDPDTGEIISECNENLPEHTGHGSDKKKDNNK